MLALGRLQAWSECHYHSVSVTMPMVSIIIKPIPAHDLIATRGTCQHHGLVTSRWGEGGEGDQFDMGQTGTLFHASRPNCSGSTGILPPT